LHQPADFVWLVTIDGHHQLGEGGLEGHVTALRPPGPSRVPERPSTTGIPSGDLTIAI
jgi:hypothetical protein